MAGPLKKWQQWRLRRAYANWQRTSDEFDTALDRLAATASGLERFAADFVRAVDRAETNMPQFREENS